MPIMNSIPLTISLVEASEGFIAETNEEASAKITAKKNKTATAMAPNTAISFTNFGVTPQDLNLTLAHGNVLFFDIRKKRKLAL